MLTIVTITQGIKKKKKNELSHNKIFLFLEQGHPPKYFVSHCPTDPVTLSKKLKKSKLKQSFD